MGPYRIVEKKGNVAYKVQLPIELRAIFPVFHVSQLKKCLCVPEERVEVRDIKLKSDLVYEEKPIAFLDRKERVTRNRVVKFYKVLWSNHGEEDATWEQRTIYAATMRLPGPLLATPFDNAFTGQRPSPMPSNLFTCAMGPNFMPSRPTSQPTPYR